jgi:hypothetical protein
MFNICLLTVYGNILARVWTGQTRANILPYKVNNPFIIYLLRHIYVSVKHGSYIHCIIIVHLVIMKSAEAAIGSLRDHLLENMYDVIPVNNLNITCMDRSVVIHNKEYT